jgi:hypothetical protein
MRLTYYVDLSLTSTTVSGCDLKTVHRKIAPATDLRR